jgi:hypothetical protein
LTQKVFFGRRETFKANAEKVFVQSGNRVRRCGGNNAGGDARGLGQVPDLVAPFLEEIRIATGLFIDFCECAFFDFKSGVSCGLRELS